MKCYIFFFILSFFSLFGYEHTVSIAAIFQNEAPYMKEWIEYHLAVGVDHFYLTNNRSEDDYLKVLKPYIDHGIVDLFHLDTAPTSEKDWIKVQQTAYLNTGVFARGKTKWMAFIDLDEFIFPVKHLNVKNFLKKYDRWPSICINWLEFGTSNIVGRPLARLLMLENCTVSIANRSTKDLKAECLQADIIISATGVAGLIKKDMVKKDAIVIDVGINRINLDGGKSKLVGDVDFESVKEIASAITPVPGGVGPMTIAY
ncbi:MAG: hypothetical protein EBU93_04520, partial [Chlamydiae bacterium]|nr:hypothetical protein [Chlamydiota bacterium]